ncbi:PTS sugar transporter subunit IIB [Anaerosinus massiliensis]|uniref:PTS sugar transporter subunit IIB n=1 Tax=Massilibacillus massiliensis TaxID=1806837 RepID=UPI000ACF8DA7|nr:PTS sugar transporter subunit IIB [Massilibacillus massiliensis]
MLKILVACGSGVATSTLAARTVEEVCEAHHISVNVSTCSMGELSSCVENADLVLTTGKYDRTLPKPVLSVTSFITGIGVEKTKKAIVELLETILSEKQTEK